MATATTYQYRVLSQATADRYQHLTYSAYRRQLQSLDPAVNLAIGIDDGTNPIGLVFAKYAAEDRTGEILSLFVVPEYRGQGIGKSLLSQMEQLLAQQGCTQVSLVYVSNAKPAIASLERILAQGNWTTPQPRMLLAHTNCIRWDNQPLVEGVQDCLRRLPLPAAFTIFPWSQVTPAELATLRSQEDLWYPASLSPCQEMTAIEYSNSLGLRYQEEIVGWVVTHRSAPDTIRYTSLFVREDLQRVGRAVPPWTLLFESILRQAQENQVAKASFTVLDHNGKMLRIVHRRIAPFLQSARYSMGTSKSLSVL